MIRTTVPALLLCCLTVAGCASSDTTDNASATDDCFYIRNINGFDAIDRDHVYLKEGVSDHYLITLFASCPGLDYARAIALSNHSGRMCPNDFGAITFRDTGMTRTCRIDNVEAVSSKDDAISIVESRTDPRDD